MEITNLLEVLHTLLEESNFHCEWYLDWSERDDYIRINFQWKLPNERNIPVTDGGERTVSDSSIPFETSVIFYNREIMEPSEERYLKTIPVDSYTGIPFGEVVAIIRYLKRITSSMRLRWRNFLEDDQQVGLSLEWNEVEFQEMRSVLIERHRYSETSVFMPFRRF
ncbi:hypothetical protein CL176_07965 [Suicoccus acidiformans]|uniref:DUF3013 domain-containing protein n=1 Tax=Suicoccus acidiformans TaxID=2036206 RepID=A0A347WLI1_9LACT|nr:DUF3013 family protein [Suicoccus acidiformans]AXY25938.1 hypothetical protein CL176_07965 [Suicoccus acidiformans]